MRLDQLRKLPEAHVLLAGLDAPGLLSGAAVANTDVDALDEDALLAELGCWRRFKIEPTGLFSQRVPHDY